MARGLVLALALGAFPADCLAGGTPPPGPKPSLHEMVKKAAATTSIAPVRMRAQAGIDKSEFGSPSFFKKPVGVAVLAALAAGVGYAIYSTQNDRVKSPAKQ